MPLTRYIENGTCWAYTCPCDSENLYSRMCKRQIGHISSNLVLDLCKLGETCPRRRVSIAKYLVRNAREKDGIDVGKGDEDSKAPS